MSTTTEPVGGRPQRRLVVLPTLVTLGNLAAGFLALHYVGDYVRDVSASEALRSAGAPQATIDSLLAHGYDRIILASWLIFFGMLCDALDGYVARVTRQESDFGIELDSLCDAITFGIAPAFLAKSLFVVELGLHGGGPVAPGRDRSTWIFALVYAVCAIIRLARFNVDTDEEDDHTEFVGLPSPAAAALVAGLVILYLEYFRGSVTYLFGLRLVLVIAGLAMVSRLRYGHFVNAWLTRRIQVKNLIVLAIASLFVGLLFHEIVVPAVALIYFLTGPINSLRHARREPRSP